MVLGFLQYEAKQQFFGGSCEVKQTLVLRMTDLYTKINLFRDKQITNLVCFTLPGMVVPDA